MKDKRGSRGGGHIEAKGVVRLSLSKRTLQDLSPTKTTKWLLFSTKGEEGVVVYHQKYGDENEEKRRVHSVRQRGAGGGAVQTFFRSEERL